jgi:hypothetical protein
MPTLEIPADRLKWFEQIVLENGNHDTLERGVCAMEAAAFLAREPHSDTPKCVSAVISSFMRAWNDSLPDEDRQKLKPFILKSLGTSTTAADEVRRAWMARDWYVRTFVPTWLELAGLGDVAQPLRELNELTKDADLELATPRLLQGSKRASAAWSAARSAARSAAWSAARSAAWSAAESAARSAAWSAAESAARSAAWSAARSAAESAAWSAARSAAWSAAESAAWSAAWSAADAALEGTVRRLQASAFELLERMCNVGR